jgi:alpha-L-rhamnosidase
MIGYPLDCPQRDERLGWFGDAQVTTEEAMFNFDMALFYRNWLSGIRLNQDMKTGDIPIISPRPYIWDEGVEWSSTYILLIWDYYRYYADKQILVDHYDTMKQYLKFLGTISKNFIIKKGWIGDWGSLVNGWEEGDPSMVPTAFYFYDAEILRKIASILEKYDDVKYFTQLTKNIKAAFNKKFFNLQTYQYQDGSQFSNAFPLFIEIVEKKYQEEVLNNLIYALKTNKNHLTTGVLGTKYVPETLSKFSNQNIAYQIATQTGYPSWAFMIEGRTTLSEFWNLKQSHNHVMMGSIDAWFYKYLAGILLDENKPGFEHIIIRPYIPKKLNFIKATIHTIRGIFRSNWERQGNSINLQVSIPVNSTAEVWIPKKPDQNIYENNKLVTNNNELQVLREESNLLVIQVQSGNFHFLVE